MTRFQRINLTFGMVLLVALTAAAARSQTFQDAVRANFVLATDLCLNVMIQLTLPATAFSTAGFTYKSVDRGVNQYGIHRGYDHYFDAPADTARAEVDDPNRIAGLCYAFTAHLSLPEASQLVAGLITQRYPTVDSSRPNQWVIRAGQLPLIVNISQGSNTAQLASGPGAVSVSMTYPG